MNETVVLGKRRAAADTKTLNSTEIFRSLLSSRGFFSPALVVLDVPVVRVVRPVRYPPAVVRHHDEGVRQVA